MSMVLIESRRTPQISAEVPPKEKVRKSRPPILAKFKDQSLHAGDA
ncbi:MAG: hypothetical protein HOP21_04475 [Methylotenera sp.]|nr:hypothetical protein [Methylotenera sp.]